MGSSPRMVGTTYAVAQATNVGSSRLNAPVISRISTTAVSGARTEPTRTAAMPATVSAAASGTAPGAISWAASPPRRPSSAPMTSSGANRPPAAPMPYEAMVSANHAATIATMAVTAGLPVRASWASG